MNHVKFMFNRINNYDLLYEDIMEGNQEYPGTGSTGSG